MMDVMMKDHPETLSQHLAAALALNGGRKPLYAALSDGRSLRISRTLMRYERLFLPAAVLLAWLCRPYWRRGVPVLRAEFMPMAGTPPFAPASEQASGPVAPFRWLAARRWGLEIFATYVREGAAAAHALTCQRLDAIADDPRIHCMMRHMLESLARILYLAPQLRTLAKERGCAVPPTWASALLVFLHVTNLRACHRLDRAAYPLQAAGLPILERDVPALPVRPELR